MEFSPITPSLKESSLTVSESDIKLKAKVLGEVTSFTSLSSSRCIQVLRFGSLRSKSQRLLVLLQSTAVLFSLITVRLETLKTVWSYLSLASRMETVLS